MTNTELIDRHLAMFQAGNVDGLIAGYADDCILLVDDNVIEGLDALRGFFGMVFAEMFPGGVAVNMKGRRTVADTTLLTWSANGPKVSVALGVDTIIVKNGKISRQTVTLQMQS
jgi:ketosteroid isomerase-like protein